MQVASRTVAVQLESSFIGSIRAIEHVVVDKVGVYAYPLQTCGNLLPHTDQSFQSALIVSVHLEHRTKVIGLQTPYRVLNKCDLPLQMKVRHKQSTCQEVCRHFWGNYLQSAFAVASNNPQSQDGYFSTFAPTCQSHYSASKERKR